MEEAVDQAIVEEAVDLAIAKANSYPNVHVADIEEKQLAAALADVQAQAIAAGEEDEDESAYSFNLPPLE